MGKRLTINEQRIIAHKKFQKLKDKFLNKEQSAIVHLMEMTDYWWLLNDYDPQASGFTHFYGTRYIHTSKINLVHVYIRLFYDHENLEELLNTIAHEFAHVYLTFNNPKYYDYHGKEHKDKSKDFLDYLLTN